MSQLNLRGSITALITPFADGKVDDKRYQDFTKWQIEQGTSAVVPCGTTGETTTLSHEEHRHVVNLCLEVAKGKVPVIAGCGSNSTQEAIGLTQAAQKMGADGALHVMPYYNKPTQEGMYQHIKAIHDASDIPIILYNVPGRTVANLSVETTARLAELPRVAGIKDATGDIARPVKTATLCKPDFIQLSGEDGNALAFRAVGGKGCISVTSNIAPALCAQMHKAWDDGDLATAQRINERLMPLHDALFCETSPGPVKYAAALLGLCRYELRLPLVPIAKSSEKAVEDALRKVGLVPADAVLRPAARA